MNDFRNYRDTSIQFYRGTNLILGPNGEGKSNIIEAIHMLSTSKSFRNAMDQYIARWGTRGYRIRGEFSSDDHTYEIGLEYTGSGKILSINGMHERKISNIIGYIYCVLFIFDDIYLITGPPLTRRNYLDLILSTSSQYYFRTLKSYLTVVKQKNRYLKEAEDIDWDLVFTWNAQLIESGSYLIMQRRFILEFINTYLENTVGEKNDLVFPFRLKYKSNVMGGENVKDREEITELFSKKLKKDRAAEIRARTALYGPHRDDFLFTDRAFEVRHFGSVGEARLSTILLKLAQSEFYKQQKNVIPILLIDDILLELDMRNMERVLSLFDTESQKIITTTEKSKLPEIFSPDRVFTIMKNGQISC
jgi:DNA replication and repair protein RecF